MQKTDLKGKKVLLTAGMWYNYPLLLQEAMEGMGMHVDLLITNGTRFMDVYPRSKLAIFRRIYSLFINDYKRVCDFTPYMHNSYDYVLSINIPLHSSYMKHLKENNSKLISVIYLWDSLCYYNPLKYCKPYDKVFTFDILDSKTKNLNYLINFWVRLEVCDKEEDAYDAVFVGKYKRLNAEKIVGIIMRNPDVRFYIKLVVPDLRQFYKKEGNWIKTHNCVFQEHLRNIIVDERVPLEKVNSLTYNSHCVIDIEASGQAGLSQRTIQGLAYHKKIITNNKYLLSLNCANQIMDIDSDIRVREFLSKDNTTPLLESDIHNSEIHNWVKQIFE